MRKHAFVISSMLSILFLNAGCATTQPTALGEQYEVAGDKQEIEKKAIAILISKVSELENGITIKPSTVQTETVSLPEEYITKQQGMQLALIQLADSIAFLKEDIKVLKELSKIKQKECIECEANTKIPKSLVDSKKASKVNSTAIKKEVKSPVLVKIKAMTINETIYVKEKAKRTSITLRMICPSTEIEISGCEYNKYGKEWWCHTDEGYVKSTSLLDNEKISELTNKK